VNPIDLRQAISDALNAFATLPLRDAGMRLFETMGHKSEKTFDLSPNSAETFLAQSAPLPLSLAAFHPACGLKPEACGSLHLRLAPAGLVSRLIWHHLGEYLT
jgi:hypothetical protein